MSSDFAMAEEYYKELINRVQTSGLNYKIEMSPFSANIFLKKTFIKDMNGNPLKTEFSNAPTIDQIKAENLFLNRKVVHLESTSSSLTSQYEYTLLDCQQVHQTNANLLQKVENLHAKLSAAEEENYQLKRIQEQIKTKEDKIQLEAKIANEGLIKQVQRLNSELLEIKERLKRRLKRYRKRVKHEIKGWKKELGEERN